MPSLASSNEPARIPATPVLLKFLDLEKLSITKSLDIYENEKKIGDLRSACFSPHFKKVIGIAMISEPFCKVSQTVYLNIDGKKVSGKVCDLPFI